MRVIRVVALCLWPSIVLPAIAAAQPVQVVHRFEVPPHAPIGGLVEAADGNLYGTTSKGGQGGGTIYRIPAGGGAPVTVHRFTRGRVPDVSMIRGIGGVLYGTTSDGGEGEAGTVFRFDPATSALTTLHVFANRDGLEPVGPVLQAANGLLYGTTAFPERGSIYALDPATGSIRWLHAFDDEGPDGAVPSGGLVEASNGFLYGVMQQVGQALTGTIYKIARGTGAVTLVHTFNTLEGARPVALTRTSDGILYGTTRGGAVPSIVRLDPATDTVTTAATIGTVGDGFASRLVEAADGSLYATTVLGHIVRLQRLGGGGHTLSTIHAPDLIAEGFPKTADLALASDGWIYGTTSGGGPSGGGTLYRFDSLQRGGGGDPFQFQVTHAFSSRSSGWRPAGPPVSWSDGALYGLTEAGGANGAGVVYRLDPVTDAFSIVGSVALSQSASGTATQHSALIDGGDGSLYALVGMNSNTACRLIRVTPATNTITVLYEFPIQSGIVRVQPVLALGPGGLYGIRTGLSTLLVYRFDLAAAPVTTPTVAEIQSLFPDGLDGVGLTATGDGKLFIQGYKRIPVDADGPSRISRVVEVITGTGAARVLANAPDGLAVAPAVGLDGRIYYAGHNRFSFGPQLLAVNPGTLTVQTLCAPQVYGTIAGVEMMPEGTVLVTVDETGAGASVWACGSATTTAVRRGVITASPIGDRVSRLALAPNLIVYGTNAATAFDGPEIIFRLPTITQPIDRDTDGLPDDWEETYGLNAASDAGADGPGGDPDGDGISNADEQVAGTHPRGLFTRYLAEGTNNAFFKTRIALLNDALVPAHVLLRFETDANMIFPSIVEVPPTTRRTIDVSTIPGPDAASFSTVVESDIRIGVERTMSWDATGYGSHTETAIEAPSTTWYFAEGSTSDQFALFYLLQNPQATAVTATIRYLLPFGQAPIERQYVLPAHSRTTIPVDADSALASTDVSGVVTATAPIIAERAMYLSKPNRPFDAGHDSAGVTAPALEWFLAEGATGPFFDLFLLIANPNASPAAVTVDYLLQGGGTVTKSYTVPGNGRFTIWVDDEQIPAGSGQKPLANAAVSMAVRSTNNVPVIVERTMWWPGPETTADFWYEAHNSPGSTTTAVKWAAADGEVGGVDGAETYVLIANPTATPGRALVRVYFDNGNTSGRYFDLPPRSRTSVAIGGAFPDEAPDRLLGTVVESLGPGAVPIVVEHAMYASPGGVTWTRGSNALAAPVP